MNPNAPGTPSSTDIGIIGLGSIGHHHAKRLGDSLRAGLDITAESRDRFERVFGVPTFDDPGALYDVVDAVIVCTPNRYHEPYALEALEKGVHVLLEKPLAHNVHSAERIAIAARDSAATCMVGFNNRFSSAIAEARQRIDRGEFGHVTHIETNYVRRLGAPTGWFVDPEISGGGVLIDLGVHALDLGLYLLGEPDVDDVSGTAHDVLETPVDDAAHMFVETDDGRTLATNAAWGAPHDSTEVIVHGTEDIESFEFLQTDVDTHAAEQEAFVDAIRAGASCNVDAALDVQRCVDHVYANGVAEREFFDLDTAPVEADD